MPSTPDPTSSVLSRREFLKGSALGLAAAGCSAPSTLHAEPGAPPKLRAAIIGHTGQGNYGHDLDLIFNDHPDIRQFKQALEACLRECL